MDAITSFALASSLSWASGLRLYLTVFIVGLLSKYSYIHLPESLHILSNPVVIGVAGIFAVIEFLADKIPYVDSAWDSIQTFVRVPAGALLAMGAINSIDSVIASVAALLGGSLTAMTHATKAGSRAIINTSPEPFSNITTSFGEEGLVLGGGWLALMHPMVFIGVLIFFVFVMLWLLPKLWRGIQSILGNIVKVTSTH
jgi:hypothetical protein